MAVVLAVLLYMLLQADDISAQTCVISPNLDMLRIRRQLGRNVEFHCQCIASNGTRIDGMWFHGDNNTALSTGDSSSIAPYQINSITRNILFINQPFTDAFAATYYCSPDSMRTNSNGDNIVLSTRTPGVATHICNIYSPSLTSNGGVMYIPNGAQNVIIYCICTMENNNEEFAVGPTRWYRNDQELPIAVSTSNPYYRNNVPAPLIIPRFTGTHIGSYVCMSIGDMTDTINLGSSDCVISPTLTALTIRGGLVRDVELHCQCMDSDGMMIAGARWFYNGRMVPIRTTQTTTSGAIYQINNTTRNILFINQEFTGSSHAGTYTCSPNDVLYSTTSGSDNITLNADGPMGDTRNCTIYSSTGGSISSGATDVILYCICRIGDIAVGPATWFNGNDMVGTSNDGSDNPYTRNNVPSPLIFTSFTSNEAGTYRCRSNESPAATIVLSVLVPVDPPTNVMVSMMTPRSVRVTWTAPLSSSDVTGYLISYNTTASYASNGTVMVSGSTTTSGTISNLEEGTTYTITVQSNSDGGLSNKSNPETETTQAVVPSSPPQMVMVTSVDPASLNVSWQPPPPIDHNGPITGYVIQYTRVGSSNAMTMNFTNETARDIILRLAAFVRYSVMVAAVNSAGTGMFSDDMTVRSGEDVPSAPTLLRFIAFTDTTVTLSWMPPDPPNGMITRYQARAVRTRDNANINRNPMLETIFIFERLDSNTEYTLAVRAQTRVGFGSFSNNITVRTRNSPPIINSVTVLTPRSVNVTWTIPSSSNIIGYLISYTTNAAYASEGNVMVIDNSARSGTIKNLEEGTTYTITVQSNSSSAGLSGNSTAVSATTYTAAPSSAPLMVVVTDSDPASLIVSWQPPLAVDRNGMITDYIINYTRVEDGDMTSIDVSSGTTETTIPGLTAYVMYSVIVAAVNVNGTGKFSDPIMQLSGQNTPTQPQFLEIVTINSSSVTLLWRPPLTSNGIITQYSIQFNTTSMSNFSDNMSSMPMVTVEGLLPDAVYVLLLKAHTRVGPGPPINRTITTPLGPVSDVTVRNESIMSSTLTLTWMELSAANSDFIHYTVFYSPVRGPYGLIMASNRKKRQSTQAGVLAMNFTQSTGMLTNLSGAVLYSIEVAIITMVNGQELTGDRSTAIKVETLEGVPTAPLDFNYTDLTATGVTLTWKRPDPPNGLITQYNISYNGTNSQDGMFYGFTVLLEDSNILSYMWTNLSQGRYQFSVIASTEMGPGKAATLMLSITGTVDPEGSSGDDGGSGGAIAGGIIGAIIFVAIIIIIILIVVYLRRRRGESSFADKSPKNENKSVVPLKDITDGKSAGSYEPEIIGLPSELRAIEGQTFSFPSHVTGKPVPDVYWYLNSRDMTEDDTAVISSNGQLTLTLVSIDHAGEWRCQATNSSGSTETRTRLIVAPAKAKPLPSPRPDRKHKPIPVSEFGIHVNMLHENSNQGFKVEYESFFNGEGMSVAVGSAPNNKPKNRFANIVAFDDFKKITDFVKLSNPTRIKNVPCPAVISCNDLVLKEQYDENRVILAPCGPYKDDYVNASPLDGYKHPRCYIAAQAPVAKTLADFWRLIWQEHPPTIVMVTNLKEGEKVKCVQYWPNAVGETQTHGPLNVSLTEEFEFADYVVRTIELRNTALGNQLHVVTQYHFTAWPDHGVPDYATAILAFHRRLRGTHQASIGPLLVHCSAGVGRTGTFITIDTALEQIKAEGVVAIYNIVDKLRHQRPHMVQSQEQYMFIHDAILESITCGNTQVSAADLQRVVTKLKQRDPHTKLTGYEQQYKVLQQVSPRLEDQVSNSALKNPDKNRPNHCHPMEKGRVILRKEKSDYINASFLKGYKQDKAFIVAQSPMKNTVRDFWKMIYDRQCASIVMLCEIMEDGREVCAPYWPQTGAFTYGDMTVTNINTAESKEFTTRVFKINEQGSSNTRQVTQFHYHSWGAHKTPATPANLLVLIEEVQRVQRSTGNKPIVVHCSNVLGRTGSFCAIFTILDRFKVEQVIDVLQTVKLLRIKRPGIVEDLDQYQFLFTVVVRYLQSFDTYSNFQI